MIKQQNHQQIFDRWEDVPDEIRARTDPLVGEELGEAVSVVFPRFARAFPRATAALERHWDAPRMNAIHMVSWLVYLVCEQPDRNLTFDTVSGHRKIYAEPYFEPEHSMLLSRWVELYRHFNSFSLLAHGDSPFVNGGMPCQYAKRLSILEAIRQGMPRRDAKMFAKAIGSNPQWLRCWLLTEAGDTLWIDEEKRDQRVWHIHRERPQDYAEIEDPGEVMDSYLAWRFAGGDSRNFDFRKGHPT